MNSANMGQLYTQKSLPSQAAGLPSENIFSQFIEGGREKCNAARMKLQLKDALANAGLKQAKLADKLGISPGYMSLLVNGERKPSPALLERMADELDITVGELYGEQQGFAEGAATPFHPKSTDRAQWAALLDNRDHRQTMYRLTGDAPAFHMMKGDLLVVDMRRPAIRNEIVIATEVLEDGTGITSVRRWLEPWLTPGTPGAEPLMIDDSGAASILGVVRAVWRQT